MLEVAVSELSEVIMRNFPVPNVPKSAYALFLPPSVTLSLILFRCLILVALLAIQLAAEAEPATVSVLAERSNLPHGIAGDRRLVFVAEPLNGRVAVLDRFSGEEIGELPPPGGLLLPFEMRLPRHGHLVVLDSGGFPSPTSKTIL